MQGIPKRNTDKQMHIPITLIEYPHGEKDYFKKKKRNPKLLHILSGIYSQNKKYCKT